MTKNLTYLLILLLCSIKVQGQLNKAHKLYDQGYFIQALPYLEKAYSQNPTAQTRVILARTYMALGKTTKAKEIIEPEVNKGSAEAELTKIYLQALLSEGEKEKAGQVLAQNKSKLGDDPMVNIFEKNLTAMAAREASAKGFKIYPLDGINSELEDFSPLVLGEDLIFTSARPVYSWSQGESRPLMRMYKSEGTSKGDSLVLSEDVKPFFKKAFDGTHTGPFTADASGNFIIISRNSEKKAGKTSKPALFYLEKKGNKWTKPQKLSFITNEHSYSHPALSPDGKTIFFTSDISGGYGGTDIYFAENVNGIWTTPQNAGPEINTPGNESFPYLHKNGTLYFSSNLLPGYGGMDIFSTSKNNGKWSRPENAGNAINGPNDDFGISFYSDELGFFTSNRPGGSGADDIYLFTLTRGLIEGKIFVSANKNDPAKGIEILLKDTAGNVIAKTITSDDGGFKFENLNPSENYLLASEEVNTELSGNIIFLSDKSGELMKKTNVDSKGNFEFYSLRPDENYIGTIDDQTWLTISGTVTKEETNFPVTAQAVSLLEGDELKKETLTNEHGEFLFEKLDKNSTYSLKIDQENLEPGMVIVISDQFGQKISTMRIGENQHSFHILATEQKYLGLMEEVNTDLRIDLKGTITRPDNSVVASSPVSVYDGAGNLVGRSTTDEYGNFVFKNLDPNENYMVMMDEADTSPDAYDHLYIKNENGEVILESKRNSNGIFKFNVLKSDYKAMNLMSVDNTSISLDYRGSIMAGDPPFPVSGAVVVIKDKSGEIIARSTTDKKGRFIFPSLPPDENYIMGIESSETSLKASHTVYLANYNGKIIRELILANKGLNSFSILPYEKRMMSQIAVSDTKINFGTKGDLPANVGVSIVYFGLNSSSLSTDSRKKMDGLLLTLKNTNNSIEVSGFTDSRGTEQLNLALSRKRAEAIADYLAARGIPKNRITVRYFGETKLLNSCSDGNSCAEEDHAVNRRGEIKIQ